VSISIEGMCLILWLSRLNEIS